MDSPSSARRAAAADESKKKISSTSAGSVKSHRIVATAVFIVWKVEKA
jgi:hypothetical protein